MSTPTDHTILEIDPICGLPISDEDRADTLRLLAQFLAKHPPVVDDEDELRFVRAEVPA